MGQFLVAFSPLFTVGSFVGGEDKAAGFEGLSRARREERLLIRAVWPYLEKRQGNIIDRLTCQPISNFQSSSCKLFIRPPLLPLSHSYFPASRFPRTSLFPSNDFYHAVLCSSSHLLRDFNRGEGIEPTKVRRPGNNEGIFCKIRGRSSDLEIYVRASVGANISHHDPTIRAILA